MCRITHGRISKAGEQQLILGKGVADALASSRADYVTVMIPNSDPQMKLLQPKRIRLQVTGILQLSGQLDHSLGYGTIGRCATVSGYG
jgi:lipoprotein-releasing system permease protein